MPLGDLLETRRLVLAALAACCASLVAAALARNAAIFLLASLVIGVSSTAVQILVPYAAHLAPPHMRGRTVAKS